MNITKFLPQNIFSLYRVGYSSVTVVWKQIPKSDQKKSVKRRSKSGGTASAFQVVVERGMWQS